MKLVKVDFKSSQIEVIEQTQSIVVKDICEHIGLNHDTQIKKIKADESYESKLIKVQTRGGLQEVFTIPLSKLNGWLFSINPNKVKPEVKQKLIEYKKECFNVLNNYFNNGIAINHRASNTSLLEQNRESIEEIIRKGLAYDGLLMVHKELEAKYSLTEVLTEKLINDTKSILANTKQLEKITSKIENIKNNGVIKDNKLGWIPKTPTGVAK